MGFDLTDLIFISSTKLKQVLTWGKKKTSP